MNHIRKQVEGRGITRLCHFTPSRNLPHILRSRGGLFPTQQLEELEKVFNPTDTTRWDGYRDHVCCSIQYPNGWYLRQAVGREKLFRDWVVLLLRPSYLWMDGTKFCVTNAAYRRGELVRAGLEAFEALFADEVVGRQGTIYTRSCKPAHLPTDDQAEVLIPDHVDRDGIIGMVVSSEPQAQRESVRLKMLNLTVPRTLVAPTLFDPDELSPTLRSGRLPDETVYDKEDEDA